MRTLIDVQDSDRPHRRTALITRELARYKIDIAAISETRLVDAGSLEETGSNHTVFWRELSAKELGIHGVGFIVRTSLLRQLNCQPTGINERLMTWRIALNGGKHATLVAVYVPTLNSEEPVKDTFYDQLHEVLRGMPNDDKVLLMGDFNARVGSNHHVWKGVVGRHGAGKCNSNGLRLLTLCAEHRLTVTNTRFRLRVIHKTTWMYPRSQ